MEINETQFELDKKDYSVSTLELDVENAKAALAEQEELASKKTLFNSGAVSKDEYEKLSEQVAQAERNLTNLS